MAKLNKIILYLFVTMYGFLVSCYTFGYYLSGRTLFDMVNCLANQALFIVSIVILCIFYKKDPCGDRFRYVAMIVNCVTYLPIVLLSGTSEGYIVGICNACLYLLYLDVKVVGIYSTWVCIVTIVNCLFMAYGPFAFDFGTAKVADIKSSFTQILSAVLFAVILTFSTKMAKDHNDEKIEIIKNSRDKMEKMVDSTVNAVMNINEDIKEGNQHIVDLDFNSDSFSKIFERIMEGNVDNTQSIQNQAEMTHKISQLIYNVVDESNEAKKTTEISLKGLDESKRALENLQYSSDNLVQVNNEVVESMNRVAENMRDVKNITELISEISEETNLLSLNASIESAKAGKYGKGFTVVAKAIRRLSIQTTNLTEDIDNIINSLEKETTITRNLLDKSSNSIQEESSKIEDTMDKFNGMQFDMINLGRDMGNILESTDNLVEYNNAVISHIERLAAEAQEVTASMEEAYAMVEVNKQKASETKDIMLDVVEEVKKLL